MAVLEGPWIQQVVRFRVHSVRLLRAWGIFAIARVGGRGELLQLLGSGFPGNTTQTQT